MTCRMTAWASGVLGQGIWKSADQGKTFARADAGEIGGRCETSYALQFDPAGKRLACFMLDGKCAMTADGGAQGYVRIAAELIQATFGEATR